MHFSLRFLILLPLAGLGCTPTPPAPARAHGTVLVNGRPLRGGTVAFVPDRQHGNRGDVSYAVVADDGSFELRNSGGMGAVPGWHRITVAPPADAADLAERMEKYRYPDQSGLSREVKPGQDNDFSFRIEVP